MNRSRTAGSSPLPRTTIRSRTLRVVRRYGRLGGGAVILAVLTWRFGTGPFLDGLGAVDGRSLAAAAGIGFVATCCCAWRWRLVGHGLGVKVPLPTAISAYYRSQFLNMTLPGGVLGDVHRGLRHGRDVGDVGKNLRAVAWERGAGQGVQVIVTILVLLIFPSAVRGYMPVVAVLVVTGFLLAVVLANRLSHGTPSPLRRVLRAAAADIRGGLLEPRAWPGITLASIVVVAGHTTTFLIAARAVGATSTVLTLVPLALLALAAMSVPINIGGWGPREGVAAWAFAASGLGAAQGVTTAVVYGVLGFVATLPGAVVLVVEQFHRAPHRAAGAGSVGQPDPALVGPEAHHGG